MSKKEKFEFGPIQKLWLKRLKEHPELQMTDTLGEGNPKNYKACCLGELILCQHRIQKKKLPFNNNNIVDNKNFASSDTLSGSYEDLGLIDDEGRSINSEPYAEINNKPINRLSQLNDLGMSWKEIAEIVEKDPTNVFTKSV